MNGNFKARCIRTMDTGLTVGKVYEFVNGFSNWNDGDTMQVHCKNIGELNDWLSVTSKFEEVKETQSIIIYRKGRDTIATLKEGKTVIRTAKATCNPTDTWSDEVGAKLALARIYDPSIQEVGIKTVETVKEVKRPAKVGEWIKVVDDGADSKIKIGDIGQCLSSDGFRFSNKTSFQCPSRYVVLENYTPETTEKTIANYTDAELIEELTRRLGGQE